jgi:hypothetical protein
MITDTDNIDEVIQRVNGIPKKSQTILTRMIVW